MVEKGLSEGKGRATPSRRSQKEETSSGGGNIISRSIGYFQDVRSEIDKVSWPSRPETIRLTRIVIIVTIISSIALGLLSLILSTVVREGLQQPIIFVVAIVLTVVIAIYWMRRGSVKSKY